MGHPKRKVVSQPPFFRCENVSFRECNILHCLHWHILTHHSSPLSSPPHLPCSFWTCHDAGQLTGGWWHRRWPRGAVGFSTPPLLFELFVFRFHQLQRGFRIFPPSDLTNFKTNSSTRLQSCTYVTQGTDISQVGKRKINEMSYPKLEAGLPSRELTYPTNGKGKSSSQLPLDGDMSSFPGGPNPSRLGQLTLEGASGGPRGARVTFSRTTGRVGT